MKFGLLSDKIAREIAMYHITPKDTWLRKIKYQGIVPRRETRGIYGQHVGKAIYLFKDENTAEDGLVNWMWEQPRYEDVESFALLKVMVNPKDLTNDPELAGSFITKNPIPKNKIQFVRYME